MRETFLLALFQNIHELRTQLTGLVYRAIPKDEIDSFLDDHQFESLIQQDIKNDSFPDSYNQELQSSIEKFLESDYQYFHEDTFFDNELQELHRLMSDCWDEVNEYLFVKFRKITEKQLKIIG